MIKVYTSNHNKMNQEIKEYIDSKFDSKFDFIYKLLNVCEICKIGTYKMTGSACYPPLMKCSNCGKNKHHYIQASSQKMDSQQQNHNQ